MTQHFFIPHPALQDFVSNIMIFHAVSDISFVCPFPPIPQHCIYFYINDPVRIQKGGEREFTTKAASLTVGAQLTRIDINIGNNHLMLCVSFHPGGLHRLLNIPMHSMMDKDVDTSLLFKKEISEVNERLKEAETYEAMKAIAEHFLLKKLSQLRAALPFDKAMQFLVQHDGNISMDKIASLSCLSIRQFERKCKERIGLPPKLFARLTRFSKAYRMKEQQPHLNWTSLAYECGYFDQMHLIRDFKEFTGVTPSFIDKELGETTLRLQANLKL